ncbi:MAG: SIMPL domain-containing protein [Acidimicrobiia bacterium]
MKNGLIVTATGRASAAPDRAAINLGVSAQRPEAGAALAEVGEKTHRLIEVLVSLGVTRDSLQTSDLSLWAETDRNGAPAGYRARNTLRAALDEVERVGEILQAGLSALGNGAEMNGLEFSLRDPSAVAAQARDMAFQEARAKAEQFAALAGRGLGSVTAIVEADGRSPEPRAMAKLASDSMPVEAGAAEVVVNLTVRFALVG